jgi:dipeptidyl aminopeptidase/acylaminoacyl peptidase
MKRFYLLLVCIASLDLYAQDDIEYKLPPKEIYDLVMAKPTPTVNIDSKGNWMLILEHSSLPGVDELAQPELRIAGIRINPNNFGPSRYNPRAPYIINIKLKDLRSGTEYPVSNLPQNLKALNVRWSPDENKVAFTQTGTKNIDLYVIDIATRKAMKWNRNNVNTVMGANFSWIDNNTIIYPAATKPATMAPSRPLAPKGPVIQQNLGKVAASRTYQDLIKNPYDEALFEFYATTQLINNNNGNETKVGEPGIFNDITVSPDRKYLLLDKINKPYSYLVTAGGFPSTIIITDINGKEIKTVAKIPSSELAPTGFDNVLNAPRRFNWKLDEAATLTWIEPLDSGMIKKKMDFHEAAYSMAAPFNYKKELMRTALRISAILPVNDTLVLVYTGSQASRRSVMSKLNPQTGKMEVLIDRSTNDAYNNPGTPVTAKNRFNRSTVKLLAGSDILMTGTGSSPEGDLPFLSSFNINTKKTKMLWRSQVPYYEEVTDVLDFDKIIFITQRQSQEDQPNYYKRDLSNNSLNAITAFPDPQPQLRGITKQKISYKRKDGIDLTANLYLPKGYDPKRDGPLPVIMWAYPREFLSAADAAQVRGSKYTFTRLSSSSAVFFVTQGYAVLDNTEFPIVAETGKLPNDNFTDQLAWNAEAAINKVAEMGVGDRKRVAVGGHSYGAFMTANLLAHTRLFKAGIAESGAYNRTLTPFGFQNEDRTYWEAPDVYFNMSPFSFADKIKDPLLMFHGELDNNPGTFPIQSERLYNAIKGHGGIVRFVQLPFEAHGYVGRENVLHRLWEMNEWLNKYVKGK